MRLATCNIEGVGSEIVVVFSGYGTPAYFLRSRNEERTRSVGHTDSRDDDGPPRDLKEEKIGIARRKEEGG